MKIPSLCYILSLPRSGSTVLTAMLDRLEGIVSPPESSFPQVLGAISKRERMDKRWLAALYLGATFTPTPLSIDDAEECMTGNNEDILLNLGRAVAVKMGRDVEKVRSIIWKTPRTVGMLKGPLSTGGKFIVLRRNPQNVFESQFRVDFGVNNRKPFRFAVFRESYEHAFARIPRNRLIEIEYDALPGVLEDLLKFLGIEDLGEWQVGRSSLEMAAVSRSHMSEVTQEFRNTDPEKRTRLGSEQVSSLARALFLARPLRPFLGPVRAHFDNQSMGPIRERAKVALGIQG